MSALTSSLIFTDNNVAQSLQSFQPVSLTPDAMPYGLGDHITKNFSGLRSLKNEFVSNRCAAIRS